jgi:tripartite-type tricarboxylate transporter receptor subunit TctC
VWKALACTAILAHASFAASAASGETESYPAKPIRLIVGFPAGGSDDYIARVLGQKLTERSGQSVIVDNRPGAAGNIAAEIVARANPDGYTLLIIGSTTTAASPSLYPKLGFDLLKDFTYIGVVATSANVFLAHPSVPVKSVSDLITLARAKPKTVRYASSGVSSFGHLAMELLQRLAKIELVHVPYKGGPAGITALAGGEVEVGSGAIPAAIPLIKAKRLNPLAVTSIKRIGAMPGVPTVAESGYPGFDVTNLGGILAPAGTPDSVVKLLNAELRSIVRMDDVKAKFLVQGLDVAESTPQELRAIMESEVPRWARIIKEAGITAN